MSALAAALIASAGWWVYRLHDRSYAEPAWKTAGASFVDESQCASCHAAEARAWNGSHHDRAMENADEPATVMGNFASVEFVHRGVHSRFFQRDGSFWVGAIGADGRSRDFRVQRTFGVDPLQQYLLELPGGRLQAYTVAWDVERKRWFDLYPAERIDFRDELHWTQPAQNWNYMCAECHSTDLHKNYDAATGTYHTSFARIDVGCQACHGPASRHLAWAQQHREQPSSAIEAGLEVDLAARDASPQVETCARCHSRRAAFWGDYRYGAPLMDTHLPSLLEAPLYHADGQILGEVYEYGSFLQSRMHAKGVRCSDCHEPHTAKLRVPGNALCTTCHNASAAHARQSIDTAGLQHKDYDSPAHHFHATGKPGSQCVDCHMPSRTYMVIDPRRDHSLRIPRPDLSVKLGTPNPCNSCHADKPVGWAAERVAQWYGPTRRREAHYAEILSAGRNGEPQADAKLSALARDAGQPAIVRATALSLLKRYPGQLANETFRDELSHSDPLIRREALAGLEALPPRDRVALARPLLTDPVRAVRIEAARLLAPVAAHLEGGERGELDAALAEYVSAQRENADRPEGWLNLGNLYASQRRGTEAEKAFRTAVALDAGFAPAYVNLADLQRGQGAEAAAEETLRAGLRSVAHDASLHHALGLALVRQRRYADGLEELKSAAKLAPEQTRYAFVYGVALHDTGRSAQAMSVLTAALTRHPNEPDILGALASYAQQGGDAQAAERYARRLREVRGETAP